MKDPFKIGDWTVEPALNRVSAKSITKALEPRLMRLLILLADTPGEPVSKDRILQEVWGGLSVTDESLSQAISKLRKVLGDDPDKPVYIETIRKQGYRLCTSVSAPDQLKAPSRAMLYIALVLIGITAITALLTGGRNTTSPQSAPFFLAHPLTSQPGRERDPVLSHAGDFVVYSATTNGTDQQLFLHGIGRGAGDRQLTNQGTNYAPAILPDDRSIVFMRRQKERCSLILLSLLDGAERIAGSCDGNQYPDTAVSADGKKIAFSAQAPGDVENSLHILDIETSELEKITTPPPSIWGDYDPVFSTDGQSLFFARSVSESMQDVYRINLETGQEQRLTNDGRNIMGIALAGDAIRFASNRDGRYGIWEIPSLSGEMRRLPISQTGILNPSTDVSGNRLVFEAMNRVSSLQATNDNGDQTTLFSFNGEILHPDASVNGQIAFTSNRSGYFEIWSSGPSGENLVRLTDFRSGFTAHPRFSPDGNQIAFDARPDGIAHLYVMDADGTNLTRVGMDDVNRYAPTWSADGKHLIFSRETNGQLELWQLDLATGVETQLTQTGGTFGYLMPDDTLLHTRPNIRGVWRLSPRQTEPELILDAVHFSDWGNWDTDGVAIRYFDRDSARLRDLNMSNGEVTLIQQINGFVPTADPAVGFAPSGDNAFVVIRERLESDLQMVEINPSPNQ